MRRFLIEVGVHLSPDQHKKVIMAAEKAGKNVDSWIAEALMQAAG